MELTELSYFALGYRVTLEPAAKTYSAPTPYDPSTPPGHVTWSTHLGHFPVGVRRRTTRRRETLSARARGNRQGYSSFGIYFP